MSTDKRPLKGISSNLFGRGFALARTGLRVGGMAASQWFTDDPEQSAKNLLKHITALTKEMGQLKGSVMKVGQLLSTYGENLFPKEVTEVLKSLQQLSPPMEWKKISARLKKELGDRYNDFEFDHNASAAASIGQVHRGKRKGDEPWFAFKVQYPKVREAIDTDLKFIKAILAVGKFLPKGPRFDQLFEEVREMLYQEMDYSRELHYTQTFAKLLASEPAYVVPQGQPDLSTKRLMVTTFEEGHKIDSPEVMALPQERRDRICRLYLELYLRELFEFRMIQTDPHFGNYRVRIQSDGNDQIVLFDFGAVRKITSEFRNSYRLLIEGILFGDEVKIKAGGLALGLLHRDDSPALVQKYVDLCLAIAEPFSQTASRDYNWSESDLPKRVIRMVAEMAMHFKLRSPPRELVFLDRKLGGVFIFISVLNGRLDTHAIIKGAIEKSKLENP